MPTPKFPLIPLALLWLVSAGVCAEQVTVPVQPGTELHQEPPRKGWFWYLDPKKEEKKEEVAPPPPPKKEEVVAPKQPVVVIAPKSDKPPEKVDIDCAKKDEWVAACGFVDPGLDFDFQAKQRDVLLQQMSINPGDPDAVEAAQRYMKWVMGKASQAANMWYFNMTQHPDLDPTVQNPISEVGLALASRIKDATQNEYFNMLREDGAYLFYFSRQDCPFCHDQAPYSRRVARSMGLPLINIPLDGTCISGFEGEMCVTDIPLEQIAVLQVKIVPTLFLYIPESTWIRLGTGVMSDATILSNTVNFFSAYRAAVLSGLDNSKGSRATVSFDPELNPSNKGIGVKAEDGGKKLALPETGKLMELMGYKQNK